MWIRRLISTVLESSGNEYWQLGQYFIHLHNIVVRNAFVTKWGQGIQGGFLDLSHQFVLFHEELTRNPSPKVH